jgi:hypothetical protein
MRPDEQMKAIADAGRAGQRAAHTFMEAELRKALARAERAETALWEIEQLTDSLFYSTTFEAIRRRIAEIRAIMEAERAG